MSADFIPCTPRQLEPDQWIAAAATAIEQNPANRSPLEKLHRILDFELVPAHIALSTKRYWGADGVRLGVWFMDTQDAALKGRILSHMNAWSQYANVQFSEAGQGNAQVRLARQPGGGYWSYLGTDILHIPAGEPTMNLDSFSMQTPESEYARVVRHETGHCLAAGTLIDCPRDLTKYPQGIPISELVGQQPWVYAWKGGRIVVRKASRVWLSRQNAPTVRVRLRTGRGYHKGQFRPPLEIVGTPDHPVLLADGVTWKNLGDLKAGDRLCSMYRSKNNQRSRLTWTGLGDRVREHVFVTEQVHGERPADAHSHHRDENQLNQSVENLEWKDAFAHHSEHGRGKKRSPEAVAATATFWRGRHHTAESRAKMAASARKRRRPANHVVVSVEPWLSQDVYDMTVPDAESFVANGVIVHNCLGFIHEHLRREIVARLDPQRTLAYFEQTQGWSAEEVQQQVLTPAEEATLTATPQSDVLSIMCYQLPPSITVDGQPIPGGNDIDPSDGAFAGKIYPRPSAPPPPPPPPPGPVKKRLFGLTFPSRIPRGGRVAGFVAPVDIPQGECDVYLHSVADRQDTYPVDSQE